ncbi:ATP-binding cassette domain-containing protein [bacterium]|nr:ATP-binding cassette domain-containing protein [bacterium]NIN92211.1 ATP-binding cassette domain-containing protein [bacterium]NIO18353.1 ATP-binding cassette domain-containing protein [bacterium]NIO73330.1 ATP-binding cassette domain-containing protein [bacterium]
MHNQGPFLEAKNLNKSYYQGEIEVRALVGINLKIMEEGVVAIFGPSGAGKSTLLHILGALDRPTEGEVIFQNSNISTLSDNELARLRNKEFGFIFQFHHLLPEFTALENVMMPLLIAQGASRKDRVRSFPSGKLKQRKGKIEEESLRILTEVGLEHRINHTPAELSAGEQQRVAVARALANSPKGILADEPTGNLDRKTGDSVFELLLALNKERGKTLVIVTHNETLVERIAGLDSGRVIHLRDGKIIN